MRNLHEVLTVRCAHCGKLRQEDSHWFAVTAVEGKFLCTPLGNTVECTGISSFAHRERRLRRNQQPACGRSVRKDFLNSIWRQRRQGDMPTRKAGGQRGKSSESCP